MWAPCHLTLAPSSAQAHKDGDAPHRAPAELQSLPYLASHCLQFWGKRGWSFILFCFGGRGGLILTLRGHLSVLLAGGSTASPQEPPGSAGTWVTHDTGHHHLTHCVQAPIPEPPYLSLASPTAQHRQPSSASMLGTVGHRKSPGQTSHFLQVLGGLVQVGHTSAERQNLAGR